MRGYFRNRHTNDAVDPYQRGIFDDLDVNFSEGEIKLAPYLRFHDAAGKHDLQLREWGCYEFLRKEPEAGRLWDALRLTRPSREFFLVVGNMCNQRTAWLVIAVLSQDAAGPLFG